jgi:hypothetical protein
MIDLQCGTNGEALHSYSNQLPQASIKIDSKNTLHLQSLCNITLLTLCTTMQMNQDSRINFKRQSKNNKKQTYLLRKKLRLSKTAPMHDIVDDLYNDDKKAPLTDVEKIYTDAVNALKTAFSTPFQVANIAKILAPYYEKLAQLTPPICFLEARELDKKFFGSDGDYWHPAYSFPEVGSIVDVPMGDDDYNYAIVTFHGLMTVDLQLVSINWIYENYDDYNEMFIKSYKFKLLRHF